MYVLCVSWTVLDVLFIYLYLISERSALKSVSYLGIPFSSTARCPREWTRWQPSSSKTTWRPVAVPTSARRKPRCYLRLCPSSSDSLPSPWCSWLNNSETSYLYVLVWWFMLLFFESDGGYNAWPRASGWGFAIRSRGIWRKLLNIIARIWVNISKIMSYRQ